MIKFYEATKTIGQHRPLMIVTANCSHHMAIGEYFILTGWAQVPYLAQRTFLTDSPGQDIPESDESVCLRQFIFGRDALEAKVREADDALHRLLFWEGMNFEWHPTSDVPLMHFAMRNLYSREISFWADESRCEEMEVLRQRFRGIRRLRFEQQDLALPPQQPR